MEPFEVGQFLNDPNSKTTSALDFLLQNKQLVGEIIFGHLSTALFSVLFAFLNSKFSLVKLKNVLVRFLFSWEPTQVKQRLILISSSLFLFILLNILTNLIKTGEYSSNLGILSCNLVGLVAIELRLNFDWTSIEASWIDGSIRFSLSSVRIGAGRHKHDHLQSTAVREEQTGRLLVRGRTGLLPGEHGACKQFLVENLPLENLCTRTSLPGRQ